MILVLDGNEAREYLRYLAGHTCICKQETILRPQESGPCVHIDSADDDDPDVVQALGLACRHPDGMCPHLDAPDVLCSVRDACYAMSEVARMREACEAEQDEQDADMTAVAPSQTYKTVAPEFVEPEPEEAPVYTTPARPTGRAPVHVKEWTLAEDAAIRDATTAAESVALYRSAVPDSGRSDAAIRVRWYKKIRPGLCEAPDPLPDFVGDVVPVTQCEEPVFLPGDRVQINHALYCGMTGTISRYYEATDNYLVAIDGLPDKIILRDKDLEVGA